ncbi:response regulator transcription factor [Actinoplanes sp. NPDC051470]|uniref:response regulator transcription factor n=1 Tax=unclassified Actinoplanes TaxID=2626549 RepID=UPI003439DF58
MRVLVTEDDENLRIAVDSSLRVAGFAVDTAGDLPEVDLALSVNVYDCAVFDRMLPTGDSLDYVARRRRDGWTVPVLFLTGRGDTTDRVEGLAWGDDYLSKPFATAELVVRVRKLCRWAGDRPAPVTVRFAGIEIDPERYEASRDGRPLTLTAKQFVVLERLVRAAGRPVPRAVLIAAAWDELVPPASNVLDVLVAQLRGKLGKPAVLHTVRGVGYLIRAN